MATRDDPLTDEELAQIEEAFAIRQAQQNPRSRAHMDQSLIDDVPRFLATIRQLKEQLERARLARQPLAAPPSEKTPGKAHRK